MRITLKGIALGLATVLASAWLLINADRASSVDTQVIVNSHHLPPYWHQQPPTWCQEDMLCWIGTVPDGRSDRESMRDWRFQLHRAHDFDNRHRVGPALADQLAESGYPRATTRDWTRCWVQLDYDGHYLWCPDGFHTNW